MHRSSCSPNYAAWDGLFHRLLTQIFVVDCDALKKRAISIRDTDGEFNKAHLCALYWRASGILSVVMSLEVSGCTHVVSFINPDKTVT